MNFEQVYILAVLGALAIAVLIVAVARSRV